MPARPRHCNGQVVRFAHLATGQSDREGERRGPEPGDDPRSFSERRPSRGGSRHVVSSQSGVHPACSGVFSWERTPFLFFSHPRVRRRAPVLVMMSMLGMLACSRMDRQAPADSAATSARSLPAAASDTDDFGAMLPTDASFAARVVSLNPAATEVIFAIGAQSNLVGRSAWDEFPAEAKTVPSLGNGIRPNVEAVLETRPTLVILYATADNRAAADAFARAGVRVITLRVDHIAQFVSLTQRLGVALGAVEGARIVVDSVQRTLAAVREVTKGANARTVVWPLWKQPVMVVGAGSYLDELIEIAGGRNAFHDLEAPSPIVSVEEIARRNPDVIVASQATSAELRAHPQWRAVRAVRDALYAVSGARWKVRAATGEGTALGARRQARRLRAESTSPTPLKTATPARTSRVLMLSPSVSTAPAAAMTGTLSCATAACVTVSLGSTRYQTA